MHQPSHSVRWHPLDLQMHHAAKSVQSFNWVSSTTTTTMPTVIPSQAAAKVEVKGVKVSVPDAWQ